MTNRKKRKLNGVRNTAAMRIEERLLERDRTDRHLGPARERELRQLPDRGAGREDDRAPSLGEDLSERHELLRPDRAGELDPDLPPDGRLEGFAGAPVEDATALDDRELLRELLGLIEVVRREEDGRPPRGCLADDSPDLPAGERVHPERRLVQEEEWRLRREDHRD